MGPLNTAQATKEDLIARVETLELKVAELSIKNDSLGKRVSEFKALWSKTIKAYRNGDPIGCATTTHCGGAKDAKDCYWNGNCA